MLPLDQIERTIKDLPAYRRAQIYRALFVHAYDSWEKATDLPAALREQLRKTAPLAIESQFFESKDGRTTKALTRLDDQHYTETVLMRSASRNTVCVSTQVGCPMGCVFCASGTNGLTRNLTFEEIVGQVLLFERVLKAEEAGVTNIVFMGIGEPFLNYDNLSAAIKFLNRPDTLNIGARRFSISTCGITSGIKRLSGENELPVNLAVSLHSAIDEKRVKLMPEGRQSPVAVLAASLKQYFAKTKRKIMLEYVLLAGVNTSYEDAMALREFINAVGAAYVVNLIPLNASVSGYSAPSGREVSEFKNYLDELQINHVQRFAFGAEIKAACGQLAGRAGKPSSTSNA